MPSPSDYGRGLWRVLGVALCALVVLTGCGGGEEEEPESLDEQIGLDEEGGLQRQIQAESIVRDCMKGQGFTYVPVDPTQRRATLVGSVGLSAEEFERQFGYGITTLYEQNRRLQAEQAAAAGVSEADRPTYDRALYGERTDATLFEALDAGDFSRLGGCSREATNQVFGGADVVDRLQAGLDELDERVASDPRMAPAVDAWSECMRAAGHDLARPEDVDTTLAAKLEAIVGPPQRSATVVAYDQAALAALQREEVALVAADVRCEEEHLSEVEDEVQAEAEEDFREQNADLLAKIPEP
ncbi:MAG TPA: hypothetical protein VM942_11135 [Acidimicrobiales bacterium]|nr:hypothetical protein [Acidimicrobiales bacterium]